MKIGTIFSMEEFAVNDGPGIRTTVFFKGCPLRCAWCHNPESILPEPQYLNKKGQQVLCGYRISSEELATKLLVNKRIYELNQGGVTLTGGEPLFQSEFVSDVLERLTLDVHTAIETSGYASEKIFQEVVSKCRLVMFDIKHTDPYMHKAYTGVSNEPILRNLDYLCRQDTEFIVRIPLIPGVNDTRQNMLNIRSLIRGAHALVRVEILPYNKLAGSKYVMIDKNYNPSFDTEAEPYFFDVFSEEGVKVKVM